MTDCDDKTPMETSGSDEKPDKQTLLAVLQVLKKYNLTVGLNTIFFFI